MDGVKLFPYFLERSTNVPKAALKAIECPELPEAAEAYRTAVLQLQAVGAEGIQTLEHAYSLCQNPDYLKAKRKMISIMNLMKYHLMGMQSLKRMWIMFLKM